MALVWDVVITLQMWLAQAVELARVQKQLAEANDERKLAEDSHQKALSASKEKLHEMELARVKLEGEVRSCIVHTLW
jgi:hypothetical protein